MEVWSGTFGANIEDARAQDRELTDIVKDMQEKLAHETRILEGTEMPNYEQVLKTHAEEFSVERLTEEQWNQLLLGGFSTTAPTRTTMRASNNSSSSADLFNRGCPIRRFNAKSTMSSTNSCEAKSDDCGAATDAMNESFECTVPTISEPTDGTLCEEK